MTETKQTLTAEALLHALMHLHAEFYPLIDELLVAQQIAPGERLPGQPKT